MRRWSRRRPQAGPARTACRRTGQCSGARTAWTALESRGDELRPAQRTDRPRPAHLRTGILPLHRAGPGGRTLRSRLHLYQAGAGDHRAGLFTQQRTGCGHGRLHFAGPSHARRAGRTGASTLLSFTRPDRPFGTRFGTARVTARPALCRAAPGTCVVRPRRLIRKGVKADQSAEGAELVGCCDRHQDLTGRVGCRTLPHPGRSVTATALEPLDVEPVQDVTSAPYGTEHVPAPMRAQSRGALTTHTWLRFFRVSVERGTVPRPTASC